MGSKNILTFIHISDIHFAKTSGDPYDIDDELRQAMLYDLNISAKKQLEHVNGILVCGDLAFSGKAAEYDIACKFLDDVTKIFNLGKKDIFCVAGNHDVDQTVVKSSFTLELIQNQLSLVKESDKLDKLIRRIQKDPVIDQEEGLLYKPLEEYNKYFEPMACNYTVNSPNWSTAMPLDDEYDLIIYGMNSVMTSNHKDHYDDNGHKFSDGTERKMSINRGQIPKVREKAIYLSLCHHPIEYWNDNSLSALMDARVKLQLYGHKHIQSIDANECRIRICSGALQPERGGDWYPKYNWIQIWVENNELFVKIYPRAYDDKYGRFGEDTESCADNCNYQLCKLSLVNKGGQLEEESPSVEENNIRRTTVMTKEIVYRFSILSDRDQESLLKQFPMLEYKVTQEIDVLLSQIDLHNLQDVFLQKLTNKEY